MLKKVDQIGDLDKPLLIVGWGKVKNLYPEQKITNKVINTNIFWTFSEKEKISEHKKDINNFKKYCFDLFDKKYNLYFLNPFEIKYSQIKKLITKVRNLSGGRVLCTDKHFFIYINNIIVILNTDFLELTSVKVEKLIKWFKNNNFEIFQNIDIFNIEEINLINNEYLILPIKEKIEYEKEFIVGYIFE